MTHLIRPLITSRPYKAVLTEVGSARLLRLSICLTVGYEGLPETRIVTNLVPPSPVADYGFG